MERYAAFRVDPAGVREVGFIDNESIAFPMTHSVSTIGRRHGIPSRSSIDRNDLEAVIRLRQHDEEFRSLYDLPDSANIEEAYVQSAERGVRAAQRRVIFIGHGLGLSRGGRRLQT